MTGDELVELKRHAHKIPDCPGLDQRIQRYNGKGSLVVSRDELDWLVAVLDAALHDPKGYPCVQWEPWKLEYVPTTDGRCVACQRLYDRLNQESERIYEITRKQWIKVKKREKARERQKAQKAESDLPIAQIKAVFQKRGCPALVCRMSGGYTIIHKDMLVSRIRQRGNGWEVLWRSYRDKWESIGDMGGVICDTVEEATEYVLKDPMGIFWR